MLWCHCQKPGFGWVRDDIKENGMGTLYVIRDLLCLTVNNVWIFSAGIVACNWLVIFSVCITLMCTFDPTGRTFVKLKATRRRQRNLTTYTLRYDQARGFPVSLSVAKLNWSTASRHAHVTCLPYKFSYDSILCPFPSIRHRLEEGQASSWSRRLKFFMCCTRAQDTQSVSHSYSFPLRAESKIERNETRNMSGITSSEPVIKISPDRMNQDCDTKELIASLLTGNIKNFK